MSSNQVNGKNGGARFRKGYDAIKGGFPAIGRLLLVGPSQGVHLVIKQRGEYDWIAVGKRQVSSEGPQVAFGFGVGPIEALCHLDGQVNAGRWREDKPFPS